MSGSVVDSFTGEAVDSCLVEVWNADSTSVVGSTYNAGWGWRIDLPASGDYSYKRYTPQSCHARLNFSRHRRPRITLDPVKLRKRPKASADDYIEGKKTLRTELGRCRDEFILEHFRKYDSPEFPPLRKPLEVTSYGNNSFIFYPFLLYNVKKT